MKIVHKEEILRKGAFAASKDLAVIESEIDAGIKSIRWPDGADGFYLNPAQGKGRGEGNGVKPIKTAFIDHLKTFGWEQETRIISKDGASMGPLDSGKETTFGRFGVEWETGNISSSHRALNKICLGVLNGDLIGGVLILPSAELYKFLTDRVGNYRELVPYLKLWKSIPYAEGAISIIVVEHDGCRDDAPRIPKGTDGRALL